MISLLLKLSWNILGSFESGITTKMKIRIRKVLQIWNYLVSFIREGQVSYTLTVHSVKSKNHGHNIGILTWASARLEV